MRISFVLPMYNEALNIEAMVEMIRREAGPLLEDYEIVIVDDASTDGCGDLADRMAGQDAHIRVIRHARNRGLGASIRSGLDASRMPYALYSDSDLPVDFSCLRWVLPKVRADVDLLIGYRLGRAEGVRRAIMSWTYNRLIRVVFGLRVRDVNFAFKLIRRDLLERLDLRSEGSFIDAEILLEARRAGSHMVQVGLQYHVRQAGVSSLAAPHVVFGILREMIAYITREEKPAPREVIVNGDDFGLHSGINHAILDAHLQGVLTSASLLANGPAFEEAAAMARQHPDLEIGVHLTLTQLHPCAAIDQIPGLVTRDGRLPDDITAAMRSMLLRRASGRQIEAEFRAQIERVLAAGVRVTHLDGNQHVHVIPACARVVALLARRYGIPAVRLPREPIARPRGLPPARALARVVQNIGLRLASWQAARVFRSSGLAFPDRFYGFVNAGHMEREIGRLLAHARPGVTEIGCHPGRSNSLLAGTIDWGYHWEEEFQALRQPANKSVVEASGARLASWSRCRPRPARRALAHAMTRLVAALPLYLWFGLTALLVARPLDPLDAYAAGVVAAGLLMHLALAPRKPGHVNGARRAGLVVSSITPYVGFALWANNLLVALAALLVIIWLAGRGVSSKVDTLRRRVAGSAWLAGLTLLLLAACFEIKEEYLEGRGIHSVFLGGSRARAALVAAQPDAGFRTRRPPPVPVDHKIPMDRDGS